MRDYQRLTHTTWDCKYYRMVSIPKKRKNMIFGVIRKHQGRVLHDVAEQNGCKILEGHLILGLYICVSAYRRDIRYRM